MEACSIEREARAGFVVGHAVAGGGRDQLQRRRAKRTPPWADADQPSAGRNLWYVDVLRTTSPGVQGRSWYWLVSHSRS